MTQNSEKKNKEYRSGALEWSLSVVVGSACIAIFALLVTLTEFPPLYVAVGIALLYLGSLVWIRRASQRTRTYTPNAAVRSVFDESSYTVLRDTTYPVFLFDRYANILWHNAAAADVLPSVRTHIHQNMENLFQRDKTDAQRIAIDARVFSAESFVLSEAGDGLYAVLLTDVTQLQEVKARFENERVALLYIAIDNVEDILQSVQEKFRDAVAQVDDRLKQWATEMGGVIKSYDNGKYIMLFDNEHLELCFKDRFSVLDEIRDVRVGDGLSVTVSIGASISEGSLEEREQNAREAIDLALQRGGDQAVFKSSERIQYFGGRTKSVYKRSNIQARTFANRLMALIVRADNVIIMGHRYGDFDSFGSSVGLARFAIQSGVKVNIAVDLRDRNLAPSIDRMQRVPGFEQMFVDNAEGLDLVTPDTLLIITDVNTTGRAQFSDIASHVNHIVVVDHHRRTDKTMTNVVLDYIEPSASSVCEMVTDMLQLCATTQQMSKDEADILLAGILLDTKQFTKNTGTRTFGAAQYLRGAGANPSDVYSLFKTDPAELSKEAHFHTAITLYRDNVAISCYDGEADDSYRVIASKAADKMLTLRNIDAAFTLVRIGEQIHISGRSNGKINVQLILEKLHGGGHFDVAGAQVTADSIISVLETLKSSIDEYCGDQ